MTSDRIFNHEKQLNHRFDIVNAGDDDDEEEEEQSISLPSTSLMDEQPTIALKKVETSEEKQLNRLCDDSLQLDEELRTFEMKHKIYVTKLDEVEALKTQYRREFDQYTERIVHLQKNASQLKKIYTNKDEETKKNPAHPIAMYLKTSQSTTNLFRHGNCSSLPAHLRPLTSVNSSPALDQLVNTLSSTERLTLISEQVNTNALNLSRISDTLPRKDRYLQVILGGVNVSILNKIDKWKYKEEYERFKFIITGISLISSLIIWLLTERYRAFDACFLFLLVWYYCTLTIRESILIVNGSNINPWWRAHHFIATVATSILLTWPESPSYHAFRTQFFVFSFYLSFVQGLQFYYQHGCLYRLRALGETHDMDITIEGFHRWMFRGLSFLVPFLLVGYFFQLYNAYVLWQLAHAPTTHEWQVYVLSIVFSVLSLGNISTTLSVLREKLRERTRPILLKEKYQSLKTFLATNYHRRSGSLNRFRLRRFQFNEAEELKKVSKEN